MLQRLGSKLVKHGSELLSSLLDKLMKSTTGNSSNLLDFVQAGDPAAPNFTNAYIRAIDAGVTSLYITVPTEFVGDKDFPSTMNITFDGDGYLRTGGNVKIYGLISTRGNIDPLRGTVVPMPHTMMVPEVYPTIQDAIDAIPDNYWQFITVSIADGSYDQEVRIRNKKGCTPNYPPSSGQQAIIVVRSRSSDASKVNVKAFQVFSCGGTPYSPNLEKMNITGATHSDEDAAIEFYGCTSGAVNGCSFKGKGVDKCIEAYNSIISVEACDFGDGINNKAMVVKHGGVICSNSTRIGSALAPMKGVLKDWVAVAIGGSILTNDLGMCTGKKGQTRIDGVQVGFITETASKSVDGITSFSRLATTRHHTQFEDYEKFTHEITGSGSGFEYYQTGGLVVRAGTAGGTAKLAYKRERRLVRQYETSNYLGFAVAYSLPASGLNGKLVCGDVSTGNYFGIKYEGGVAKGVIASGGNEATVELVAGSRDTVGSWTCKYLGKGSGTVIFMFDDVYAGKIDNVKLQSYDGTYFSANITRERIQLYEMEFVSSM